MEAVTQFDNARYFGQDHCFHRGGFGVKAGRFSRVGKGEGGTDLGGRYVIPGLVDLHTHGNGGQDFSTAGQAGLAAIAARHARQGVAAFCPTSMSLPQPELERAFAAAAALAAQPLPGCARVAGIHMEGPFLAPVRRGAQNAAYIIPPSREMVSQLQRAAGGWIRILSLAPELAGADGLAEVAGEAVLSIGHSSADYEMAARAFDNGFSHVTHLFNAMTPFTHREPGILGAAAEREHVTAELIADGIHLHPSTVRMAFSLFGAERICLVSDSMEACGMADGLYRLGGQQVQVHGRRATLADGTLAGAVTPLAECMRNAVAWGIAPEAAVQAASTTPARRLGLEQEYGCIADGRRADFLVCEEDFTVAEVYLDGRRIV